MKTIMGLLMLALLLGGCSQKEINEGVSDAAEDVKRVIRGEND